MKLLALLFAALMTSVTFAAPVNVVNGNGCDIILLREPKSGAFVKDLADLIAQVSPQTKVISMGPMQDLKGLLKLLNVQPSAVEFTTRAIETLIGLALEDQTQPPKSVTRVAGKIMESVADETKLAVCLLPAGCQFMIGADAHLFMSRSVHIRDFDDVQAQDEKVQIMREEIKFGAELPDPLHLIVLHHRFNSSPLGATQFALNFFHESSHYEITSMLYNWVHANRSAVGRAGSLLQHVRKLENEFLIDQGFAMALLESQSSIVELEVTGLIGAPVPREAWDEAAQSLIRELQQTPASDRFLRAHNLSAQNIFSWSRQTQSLIQAQILNPLTAKPNEVVTSEPKQQPVMAAVQTALSLEIKTTRPLELYSSSLLQDVIRKAIGNRPWNLSWTGRPMRAGDAHVTDTLRSEVQKELKKSGGDLMFTSDTTWYYREAWHETFFNVDRLGRPYIGLALHDNDLSLKMKFERFKVWREIQTQLKNKGHSQRSAGIAAIELLFHPENYIKIIRQEARIRMSLEKDNWQQVTQNIAVGEMTTENLDSILEVTLQPTVQGIANIILIRQEIARRKPNNELQRFDAEFEQINNQAMDVALQGLDMILKVVKPLANSKLAEAMKRQNLYHYLIFSNFSQYVESSGLDLRIMELAKSRMAAVRTLDGKLPALPQ